MPPAARVTDPTTHGAPLNPGPGSPNVLIGNLPAWRTIVDQHACPAVSISGADGVGSVLMGSPTVFINNQMACRVGDIVVEKPGLAMGPVNPIVMGCVTVMIGEVGMGSPSAGAGAGATMAAGPAGATQVTPEEQKSLDELGEFSGKPEAEIEAKLQKQGYSGPVQANSGGKVYTKDLGNGQTMAVRLDPAVQRNPPRGWADEVKHAHKESVPTSEVVNGNYQPNAGGLRRFNDRGQVSSDPGQVHIPIK